MNFAYVSFVNENPLYINLMHSTIASIQAFSKYPLILYFIVNDIHNYTNPFTQYHSQVICRIIDTKLNDIYYYKPFVINHALQNGLSNGYYIESDDVLTPHADKYLLTQLSNITSIPLSPIHPDDVTVPWLDLKMASCDHKTQHYIHGHVLFTISCLPFIQEWLTTCLRHPHYRYRNNDETVLNLIYWKHKCRNHYLPIIDPYFENFNNSQYRDSAVTYHGCKDPIIQHELFQKMKQYYSTSSTSSSTSSSS